MLELRGGAGGFKSFTDDSGGINALTHFLVAGKMAQLKAGF